MPAPLFAPHVQRIADRAYYWGMLVLAFSLPLLYGVQNIAFALAGAGWIAGGQWRGVGQRLYRRPTVWLWWGLSALGLLSLLYTANIAEGVADWTRKLAFVAIPLILALSPKLSVRFADRLLIAFVFGCLVAAVICGVAAVALLRKGEGSYVLYYDMLVKPLDEIAVTAAWKILTALFLLIAHPFSTIRWINTKSSRLFLILPLFVFFVLLSARTLILVGLVLMVILILFRHKGSAETVRSVRWGVGLLALFAILFSQLGNNGVSRRFEDLAGAAGSGAGQDMAHADNYNKRMAVWTAAWQNLQQGATILTGTGMGDVRDVQAARVVAPEFRYKEYQNLQTLRTYKVDNMYLQLWLGQGVLGVILFGALLLSCLMVCIRYRHRGGICFFLVTGLFCMQESLLQSQNGVMLITIASSLCIGLAGRQVPPSINKKFTGRRLQRGATMRAVNP